MIINPIKIKCVNDENIPIDYIIALSSAGYNTIVKNEIYNMTHLHVRADGSLVAFLEEYDPHKFVWKANRFRTLENKELHTIIKNTLVNEVYQAKNN